MTQINATHSLNMHSILEHGSNGLNGYFLSNTDFKDYTDLNTKKNLCHPVTSQRHTLYL